MQRHERDSAAHRQNLSSYVSDVDAARAAHRFLWTNEDDGALSSEQRLAKEHHERLHREYAVGDFTRYKEGAIGLRWRTPREVQDGKGQFVCGSTSCDADEGLESFEVHFAFVEDGVHKQALVKLRVCPRCAGRMRYHAKRKRKQERRQERKQERKQERREERRKRRIDKRRKEKRRKRRSRSSDSDSSSSSSSSEGRGKGRAPAHER